MKPARDPTGLAPHHCFPLVLHRQPEKDVQPKIASHFIIRTARQSDLTGLTEILADSFHPRNGIWNWFYPLFRLGIYEDLRNRLRSAPENYICLVALEPVSGGTNQGNSDRIYSQPSEFEHADDSVVGTVEMALRPSSWQPWGSQYPYISNLAVYKSCRRRGAALQLLRYCERIALEWGFEDIYLHVLENNHQARQLYLKAGYELHKVDPSWSDLLFMRPRRLFLHKHLTPKLQNHTS